MWRLPLVAVIAPSPPPRAVMAAALLSSLPRSRFLAFTRGGDLWTVRGDGTGARLLLRRGYSPAWSPDGSRIAFVSLRSGDEEIYSRAPTVRGHSA